jgi:Na+/proline symporter
MDEANADSLLDLLGSLYGNRVTLQFCIVNLAMYVFLLAGQFVALFLFARYVQALTGGVWLPWTLVTFAIVSMFSYPVIGGLRKDIRTDVIQVSIVLLSCVIICWRIISRGVLGSMWPQLARSRALGTGYGAVFVLGAILFLTPSFLVRMDIWQRIRASRSATASKHAFWAAATISCLCYVFFTTIGMWAYVLRLPSARYSTLDLISQEFRNPVTLGIIFGAFFAAVLSSADTFINNTSLFLTRIAFPTLWSEKKQKSAGRSLLRWSRVFAIGFIMAALALGLIVPNIVDLLVGAFSLLLIYLPAIFGLFFRRWRSKTAAFWSSNLGLALFAILFFTWNPKIAFAPAVVVTGIAYGLTLAAARSSEM